jgi:predicted metal-dependent enzyme (double-stranded beta helix superfamily)
MTATTLARPYVHPAVRPFRSLVGDRPAWTLADLARLTRLLADGAPDALRFEAVHDPAERWYLRLALTHQVEVWLLSWTPGQATRPHDHGGAAGAYTVLDGELTETWRDGPVRARSAVRTPGLGSAFGPTRVHRVANAGPDDATSVHAYSPPLLPLGTDVELA